MTATILASFPSPARGVWYFDFSLFGRDVSIPIRAYAVCIIIGIIVALVIGDRRWVARGGERGVIYDIALWAIPFGLIGGRLYHVLTDWKTYFGPDGAGLKGALYVWQGGLGIWGAVALGGVGAWIACRLRGIPLPAFGDAIAPGIILAQAIGRIGNYFNQELYGRPTDLPWGMDIFLRRAQSGNVAVDEINGVSTGQVFATVHPTFLYELLWNVLVFVIVILIDRRFTIGHGRLFASYVALYCVGRFWVELLRDDTATHIEGIRINSFTATLVFLGAVVYIILAPKGREDPSTLRGKAADAEESAPELERELAAVASGAPVVAAAVVAGREDTDSEAAGRYSGPSPDDEPEFFLEEPAFLDEVEPQPEDEPEPDWLAESGSEPQWLGQSEPEPESVAEFEPEPDAVPDGKASEHVLLSGDADDVEAETEDPYIVEAEALSPGVEVGTMAEAEGELIDEYHDPIDEEDLEGSSMREVTGRPVSEQEESLDVATVDVVSDENAASGEVASSATPAEMIVVYASDALPDGIALAPEDAAGDEDVSRVDPAEGSAEDSTANDPERGSRLRRIFRRG